MAIMIPNHPPFSPSPGEKELFDALQSAPGTSDWLVFHSLHLAEHVSKVEGEADTLIVIPEKGIVVLEVKACKRIFRTDRTWYYGTNPKPDHEGPFHQASHAMHSIKNFLNRRFKESASFTFCSGVLLTHASRESLLGGSSIEWHDWELIDCKQFRTQPIERLILGLLEAKKRHLTKTYGPRTSSPTPTQEQCEKLRDLISCNFVAKEDDKSKALRRERELIEYTKDQLTALDAVKRNPRVIFEGPAGTGKSFLAAEAARRAAKDGKKVLLCCYNKLLGQELASKLADETAQVDVSTLHHLMRIQAKISESEIAKKATEKTFWTEELPERAISALLEKDSEDSAYDLLIVDEAQDFWCDSWFDFLDLSLKGGLKDGSWYFFGDFDHQGIYGASERAIDGILEKRGLPSPAFYTLTTNCRNIKSIAKLAEEIAGGALYQEIRREDEGDSPEVHFYQSIADQQAQLVEALEALYAKGYGGSDVCVLSKRSASKCVAQSITDPPWKDRLKDFAAAPQGGYVQYGSIHAFKGMEAKAVVVTDFDQLETKTALSLLYVAATRAQEQLVILCEEGLRGKIGGDLSE